MLNKGIYTFDEEITALKDNFSNKELTIQRFRVITYTTAIFKKYCINCRNLKVSALQCIKFDCS